MPLDLTENWGLTVMPISHAKAGKIMAKPRPAARLARPQPGDVIDDQTTMAAAAAAGCPFAQAMKA